MGARTARHAAKPSGCTLGPLGASAAGACARRTLGLGMPSPRRAQRMQAVGTPLARGRAPVRSLSLRPLPARNSEYKNLCTDWGPLATPVESVMFYEALAVGCCPHPCWTRVHGAGQQLQCVGPVLGPSSLAAWGHLTPGLSAFAVSVGSALWGCTLGPRGATAVGACMRRTLGFKDAVAPARAAHAGSRDAAGARPRPSLGASARVSRLFLKV